MIILQFLLKKIKFPSFVGFLSAFCLYCAGGIVFFDVWSHRVQNLKQEGEHKLTLRLTDFVEQSHTAEQNKPIKYSKSQKVLKESRHNKRSKHIASKIHHPIQDKASVEEELLLQKPTQDIQNSVQTLQYNEGVSNEFLAKIYQAISSHNIYPRIARMRQIEGEVVLEFILNIHGEVEDAKVLQSNAAEILQKSALKALYEASKDFPSPKQKVRIKVPIIYQLT